MLINRRLVARFMWVLGLTVSSSIAEAQYAHRAAAAPLATGRTQLVQSSAAAPNCQRSTSRMVAQFSGGLVGAWMGGIVGFRMFDDPYGPGRKVKGDAGYTPNANTAYALGSWLGSSAGVLLTSPRVRGCGGIKPVIGTTVSSIPLFFGREEPYLPVLGFLFVAPLQALAGTLLY